MRFREDPDFTIGPVKKRIKIQYWQDFPTKKGRGSCSLSLRTNSTEDYLQEGGLWVT